MGGGWSYYTNPMRFGILGIPTLENHGFCRQVPCGDVPAGVLGGRTAAAAADLSAAGLRHAAGWGGCGEWIPWGKQMEHV